MKLCENWWKGNILATWPEVAKLKYRIDSILLTPMKQFNFVKMLSLLDNKCTKCNCKTFIIFNAFLSCNMTKKKEEKKMIFHKNFLYFQDIAYVTCCSLQLRNIWYLFSTIHLWRDKNLFIIFTFCSLSYINLSPNKKFKNGFRSFL